jgi:hypothetical protein
MMLHRLNRLATKALFPSLLIASALSNRVGVAQEPFLLIHPAGEIIKPAAPTLPTENPGPGKSNSEESLPLWKGFRDTPSSPKKETESSILILGSDGLSEAKVSTIAEETPAQRPRKPIVEAAESRVISLPKEPTIEDFVHRLPLSWQLVNASQSPLSPILLWRGVSAPEAATVAQVNEPSSLLPVPDESLESASLDDSGEAPSLVIQSDNMNADQLLVLPSDSPASTASRESSPSLEEPKLGSGKRPRNVRIPFDAEENEPTTDESVDVPAYQPAPIKDFAKLSTTGKISSEQSTTPSTVDDQKGQEAPIIDMKSLNKTDEEQGTDALRASKPNTPSKRRIKIEDPSSGQVVPPVIDKKALITDPIEANRLSRCQACLDYYLTHPESTSVRSPWAVMHALLPYAGEYEMMHGNQRVNAIGWMCHNGTCRTQRIFSPSKSGFTPNVGGGVQGHQGQFMAILAQCNVPLDYPIQVGSNKFTVEDLVRYEMATCKEKSELTFKLIGLSYYLDSNKQWRANDGKVWSLQKLIQEELSQPIVGAACGGTHRLMGYSFAIKQRLLQGRPLDGQYAKASKFINDYVAYTWKLQNADGSFSTSWYERRGDEPNEERKVQTTGHMLEWLMFTVPDAELNQPRVQKSIDFLLSKIYDKKDYKWPIGPRGHATRALALYSGRYEEIRESKPELLQVQRQVVAPKNPAPFSRR